MPHPIPLYKVVPISMRYVISRQVLGRVTTLGTLSKRMGIGGYVILGMWEENPEIRYSLIRHGNSNIQWNLEVVVASAPAEILESLGMGSEDLRKSILRFFPENIAQEVENASSREVPIGDIDPYRPYRIDDVTYYSLKENLIDAKELFRVARSRGYKTTAISRATGGDRLSYKFAGPFWRPFVWRGKRFYLREVLNHLDEIYLTYKSPTTAERKRRKREGQWE